MPQHDIIGLGDRADPGRRLGLQPLGDCEGARSEREILGPAVGGGGRRTRCRERAANKKGATTDFLRSVVRRFRAPVSLDFPFLSSFGMVGAEDRATACPSPTTTTRPCVRRGPFLRITNEVSGGPTSASQHAATPVPGTSVPRVARAAGIEDGGKYVCPVCVCVAGGAEDQRLPL